ncbi:glycosyltransferase family 8 protein [Paracoccus sp. 11-3]|uniref:Glycosyltransferase family 8 protein n=1 Tax=Paracoccus amoyensis TaxID=2760093 RepID=A0A926GFH6_9RHOB|nr:glycosyltransferase family 8 protein [Paracoccus amoyensis]MBC9246394.1 glycosyltransferase family 8 protein [Paracoccus amoyensis]
MTTRRPVKIVYVTDSGFLNPTLVSVWSLLETLSGDAELHFWGDNLSDADWKNVRHVAAGNPRVTLIEKEIGQDHLCQAEGPKDYITAATMGRLFIPRYIDGYALYIDGDTLVTGDVSPLFDLDLGTTYAGVVRDFTLLHWLADSEVAKNERDARLAEVAAFMAPAESTEYFNAGILLLNCDQIRADPEMQHRIEDVLSASACSHGDQDHLNTLFDGNVTQLDIAWNLSWGRAQRHHSYFRKLGVAEYGALTGRPRILHYHGPQKPWRDPRWDVWSSKGRATFLYRRRLSRFVALYPHLKPV